jgi:hypothetical protein
MIVDWKRLRSFEPTPTILKGTFLVAIGFVRLYDLPAEFFGIFELKSFLP